MKPILRIAALCVAVNMCGAQVQAQQPDTKVTLGIKPDYWYTTKGKGVRVKGIVPGGTAERTGLKAQDIITALNGKAVRDIFVYRDMLQTFSKNDSVIITIVRNKKQVVFRSKFL